MQRLHSRRKAAKEEGLKIIYSQVYREHEKKGAICG